jgi:hypothetical protein
VGIVGKGLVVQIAPLAALCDDHNAGLVKHGNSWAGTVDPKQFHGVSVVGRMPSRLVRRSSSSTILFRFGSKSLT